MDLPHSVKPPAIHPACKRLAYANITLYEDTSNPLSLATNPRRTDLFESSVPTPIIEQLEYEISTFTIYTTPMFGGRGAHLAHFSTDQLKRSLVDGTFWHEVLKERRIWIDGDASTLNALLSEFPSTTRNHPSLANFKSRFLLLPSGGRSIFEGSDVDCSNLEIHYYTPGERDSFLLIPQQFIDYTERMKRLEPKEAKARFVWEM